MMMTNDNDSAGKIIGLAVSPIRTLLDRLNYTRKFTILWLLSAVAIAVVVYSLVASLDRVIEPSKLELEGIALVEPIIQTIQLVQIHRGLSIRAFVENKIMTEQRAAKQREMFRAFKAMEGELPARLTSSEAFASIKTRWQRLHTEEKQRLTVDDSFTAHTDLIEHLQALKVTIADDYALTLDPQIGTFYLIDTAINKLPRMIEYLGQIRAYGSGILVARKITEKQKIQLQILIAKIDTALKDFHAYLEKTIKHNPMLQDSFNKAAENIINSTQQIIELTVSDILTGHFSTPP
ncbi:MAG: nitrate- and nitrite sensing domain-containing protein, partial [Gammaproteobacteria bacterium]|nr:nitrate- and nitrite sensing domain-containing protein [Gammaproteobacteria bacterium]